MILKKWIIYLLTFIIVLGGGIFSSSSSAEPIVLKYANFPPSTTFPCVQMERWAKEVEKRTKGKVKVQTFPGGTLLPAKNIFDGVISGMADIGNFAMSYQPGRFPISEAVDLPIGFANARVASLVLVDIIEKYKAKEFEKVKIITLFTCPPASLMTSKPVRRLNDLKGMEIRVSGTSVDVLKNLGGSPIAMPQSDTPEALQKGVVKGSFSSLEVLKDFNYAAYTPYVTVLNLQVVSFAVVMNKDKWESLPADVKKVIDKMVKEQALWTGNYVDNHVKEALKWSKGKYKDFRIFHLSRAERAQVPKLMQPIINAYITKANGLGLPGEQIFKDINQLKAKYERRYK